MNQKEAFEKIFALTTDHTYSHAARMIEISEICKGQLTEKKPKKTKEEGATGDETTV